MSVTPFPKKYTRHEAAALLGVGVATPEPMLPSAAVDEARESVSAEIGTPAVADPGTATWRFADRRPKGFHMPSIPSAFVAVAVTLDAARADEARP